MCRRGGRGSPAELLGRPSASRAAAICFSVSRTSLCTNPTPASYLSASHPSPALSQTVSHSMVQSLAHACLPRFHVADESRCAPPLCSQPVCPQAPARPTCCSSRNSLCPVRWLCTSRSVSLRHGLPHSTHTRRFTCRRAGQCALGCESRSAVYALAGSMPNGVLSARRHLRHAPPLCSRQSWRGPWRPHGPAPP